MVVVVLAGASLTTTVPVGIVMSGLATFARLGRGDRSTLLALPLVLVFGVWLVVVPSVIEVWSAAQPTCTSTGGPVIGGC
jgi:hypothetical protein